MSSPEQGSRPDRLEPLQLDWYGRRAMERMRLARRYTEELGMEVNRRTVAQVTDALDSPVGYPDEGMNADEFTLGLLAHYFEQKGPRLSPREVTDQLLDMSRLPDAAGQDPNLASLN